jgi:hypothetical protein
VINLLVIVAALVLAGALAFSRRLAGSSAWKATVTPLASIMGSGFLVSAPLLADTVGNLAVICMAALLVLAYSVGGVIRFNIRHFEPVQNAGFGPPQVLAFMSRIVLAGAYFISVSYYLQLLGAFLANAAGLTSPTVIPAVSTAMLLVIGGIGMWRGLGMLEALEKYAVALNLGMIGALLLGLAVFNLGLLTDGRWALPVVSSGIDLHGPRIRLRPRFRSTDIGPAHGLVIVDS